jgi:predicted nucleic acid-binding protein
MSPETAAPELALVDTNVLVYAVYEDAPQHGASRRLLERCERGEQPLVVTQQNLAELYSTETSPRRVTAPYAPNEAIALVRQILSIPNLAVLPIPSDLHERWLALLEANPVGGKIELRRAVGRGHARVWGSADTHVQHRRFRRPTRDRGCATVIVRWMCGTKASADICLAPIAICRFPLRLLFPMPRCRLDESLERTVIDGFTFPLGAYPIEPVEPRQGYISAFEPADSGEASEAPGGARGASSASPGAGEPSGYSDTDDDAPPEPKWEEWPDRYVFEIVITSERLEALVRNLLTLFPGRIYPILDYLGHDAFREVDPYISYELMGMDKLLDSLRRYRAFFYEDGLVGFGAMIDDPFLYVFVDEHKIITIRCQPDLKEKVERILTAFDLEPLEEKPAKPGAPPDGGPAGADAAAHEHRGVLVTADDRPDLLTEDEIVEVLRDEWRLTLNVDPDSNLDEEGRDLGLVPWHCQVRCAAEGEETCRYAEILVGARSLREAEELALVASEQLLPKGTEDWEEQSVVAADRLNTEMLAEVMKTRGLGDPPKEISEGIIWRGWPE